MGCDYWRKAVRQKCFFCVIFVNGIYLGAESSQFFSCVKCQTFPCCMIGWGDIGGLHCDRIVGVRSRKNGAGNVDFLSIVSQFVTHKCNSTVWFM